MENMDGSSITHLRKAERIVPLATLACLPEDRHDELSLFKQTINEVFCMVRANLVKLMS